MALDAVKRLAEHNGGKNRFTKDHRPWKIVFMETHPDWATARKKEKYLKSTAGKSWLKKILIEGRWCGFHDCVTQSGRV